MNPNTVTDTYPTEDVTFISSLMNLLEVHHYLSEGDANRACIKLVHTWFLHQVCC